MARAAAVVAVPARAEPPAKQERIDVLSSQGREPGFGFPCCFDGVTMLNLFAASAYWDGFLNYWSSALTRQSGFTTVVIGLGVVGILIIMSGRKKLDH
jgi:hypothetical protein